MKPRPMKIIVSCDIALMNCKKGYLKLSLLLFMVRRFNINYIQLFEGIFNSLKIPSNNWRYLQLYENAFKYWIYVETVFHI